MTLAEFVPTLAVPFLSSNIWSGGVAAIKCSGNSVKIPRSIQGQAMFICDCGIFVNCHQRVRFPASSQTENISVNGNPWDQGIIICPQVGPRLGPRPWNIVPVPGNSRSPPIEPSDDPSCLPQCSLSFK